MELDTKTKIHFVIDCQKMGFYNQWFIKFIDITYKKNHLIYSTLLYKKSTRVKFLQNLLFFVSKFRESKLSSVDLISA